MRLEGTLLKWNQDRGFGFIKPSGGGPDIFVHVSAFQRSTAPRIGEPVSYEVEKESNGKIRAVKVLRPGEKLGRSSSETGVVAVISSAIGSVAALVLVGAAIYFGYQHRDALLSLLPFAKAESSELSVSGPQSERSQQFACDGRTHCSQMTSCEEARYFLKHCPGAQMDGNHDGEPCEQQWCL